MHFSRGTRWKRKEIRTVIDTERQTRIDKLIPTGVNNMSERDRQAGKHAKKEKKRGRTCKLTIVVSEKEKGNG